MRTLKSAALVAIFSVAAACSGNATNNEPPPAEVRPDASSQPNDAGSVSDAATVRDAATFDIDAGTTPIDSGTLSPCDASACASLVGKVMRKAATKPQHGGVGDVYVAVFDGNPITDAQNAKVVARTLLTNVDLTQDTAQVAYRVDGIPARAQGYQVIAFLDDDRNASAQSPGPSKGDLVTIDLAGFSGIKLTVATPGDTTLDLPLNAALP